jgi:phosphatidylinositol alpha-1,6-mannosyltransferase
MHKFRNCLMAVTGAFEADGGMAAVNRLVIRSLQENGCSVEVHALQEPPRIPSGSTGGCYHAYNSRKSRFALSVCGAIARKQPDFVFADLANLAAFLAPLARSGLCRYALWLHGLEVFPPRPDWKGRLGLKNAWKLFAGTPFTRDSVLGRFHDLRVDVCELAIDAMRQSSPPRCHNEVEEIRMLALDGSRRLLGERVILHVGRMPSKLERRKGQDWLLRAFPLVCRQVPEAQLVLAGNGDDFQRVNAIGKSLAPELQGRVFMPGHVSDEHLRHLYRKCFVFAMPSLLEGFGIVYIEAMSQSKPCLGARAAATPFVIQDGVTGLLVDDPSSADQLAARLLWLLQHPHEAREMGIAGYRAVCDRYLFPHFSARFWHSLCN